MTAAADQLFTAGVDDRTVSGAVNILETAVIDFAVDGFPGNVNLLHTARVHAGVGCGAFDNLGTAKQQRIRGSAAFVDMLQTTGINQRACGKRAGVDQLNPAIVDYSGDRRAVYRLSATAVDDSVGGFTGCLNKLVGTVIDAGAGGRTGNNLPTAAKHRGVGRCTTFIDVLQAATVNGRVIRQTAAVHQLDAAVINNR